MSPIKQFVAGFLACIYGSIPQVQGKAQRSPEQVADLQAHAALKRQRKAKKRIYDNFRCVRNNYDGHSTNYLA